MTKPVKLPGPDHPITIAPHPDRVVVTAPSWVIRTPHAEPSGRHSHVQGDRPVQGSR